MWVILAQGHNRSIFVGIGTRLLWDASPITLNTRLLACITGSLILVKMGRGPRNCPIKGTVLMASGAYEEETHYAPWGGRADVCLVSLSKACPLAFQDNVMYCLTPGLRGITVGSLLARRVRQTRKAFKTIHLSSEIGIAFISGKVHQELVCTANEGNDK